LRTPRRTAHVSRRAPLVVVFRRGVNNKHVSDTFFWARKSNARTHKKGGGGEGKRINKNPVNTLCTMRIRGQNAFSAVYKTSACNVSISNPDLLQRRARQAKPLTSVTDGTAAGARDAREIRRAAAAAAGTRDRRRRRRRFVPSFFFYSFRRRLRLRSVLLLLLPLLLSAVNTLTIIVRGRAAGISNCRQPAPAAVPTVDPLRFIIV